MINGNTLSSFDAVVNDYYQRLNGKENYFQLMGIPRNATQKQIEEAYAKKIEREFPRNKIEPITDSGLKEKAVFILQRIDYMFSHLVDFDKRSEYETQLLKQEAPVQEVPKVDPVEQAREHFKLGKTLYDQKAYPMALSALKEAVRLDPKKAAYFHQLALCQMKDASLKREAEHNLRKALELEPWNGGHHAALGMLYFNLKMNRRAEACFRESLSLDPDNTLARRGLEKIGPQKNKTGLNSARDFLKKVMPTLFDRK